MVQVAWKVEADRVFGTRLGLGRLGAVVILTVLEVAVFRILTALMYTGYSVFWVRPVTKMGLFTVAELTIGVKPPMKKVREEAFSAPCQ